MRNESHQQRPVRTVNSSLVSNASSSTVDRLLDRALALLLASCKIPMQKAMHPPMNGSVQQGNLAVTKREHSYGETTTEGLPKMLPHFASKKTANAA